MAENEIGKSNRGKANNFEDLNVYIRARELANEIYGVTKKPVFSRDFALQGQIRRSAISILSNIAEGFERGSKKEFIQFLYIARGSCGEIRAQLSIACDQKYIEREIFQKIHNQCKMISGMLANFLTHLKTEISAKPAK